MAPALGISKFGLEGPAVGTIIDQLRRVVLTCRSHDLEAHAQDGLVLPRLKLLCRHSRTTLETH